MKKLFVDFKESKKWPNDQLICIYDCQKRRGIQKDRDVEREILSRVKRKDRLALGVPSDDS
jgi:hypothetical protein